MTVKDILQFICYTLLIDIVALIFSIGTIFFIVSAKYFLAWLSFLIGIYVVSRIFLYWHDKLGE